MSNQLHYDVLEALKDNTTTQCPQSETILLLSVTSLNPPESSDAATHQPLELFYFYYFINCYEIIEKEGLTCGQDKPLVALTQT